MGRLQFERLSTAWRGEAANFTPLLAERLDQLGAALGFDLAEAGQCEVLTDGGRRIDIVAQDADGAEVVIENQYGIADHDHLTRGLAYAVARHAKHLVVVAEQHRDEFRAVAQYLNTLAELDDEVGIQVWLVEAQAVRVDESAWAPLFTAVVKPNRFTAVVERQRRDRRGSLEEFWELFDNGTIRDAAAALVDPWVAAGHRYKREPAHLVLEARGPSKNGWRAVVTLFPNGQVQVPFSSYAGVNSYIGIRDLMTDRFRTTADAMFGFSGAEKQARTAPGWLHAGTSELLSQFCASVADAYARALDDETLTVPLG